MNHVIISVIGVVILIVVLLVLYLGSRKSSNIMPMEELLDFETDSEGNIIQGTLSPRASALMDALIDAREENPGISEEEAYSQAVEKVDGRDPMPLRNKFDNDLLNKKANPDQIESP